ncbi:MAG TPA: HypC/HybG/HupF family hydrogenase formation chaperone [Bacillota bacterium]|jgi:hydrogenase expression/formation protein HypC|nr:HypC/HybG/HupF family hydrogenase formation chaperone [Bacillota bacterium]HOB87550.1 HypC/HybG/HupF family hydrogenase formation chaperone [Bacillota bacterium]HOP68649.1 HypC/HybG/HupF family hydrogenase formation chaperone [Bacillota bacterium]HPT33995.1 HypC/HybG/HupF family hydrogenase formation chaperone [Bacillota bacterium]HPZ64468.1 HypC/HybG/HupF family hydrogenase formation chaperone [Bacillota bacterium]
MCLAIPGKIVHIGNGYAEIDYGGVSRKASLRLVQGAKVGDYALVHAGFVIQILDQEAGEELSKFIEEIMEQVGSGENERADRAN